jgi:hypothetical protein
MDIKNKQLFECDGAGPYYNMILLCDPAAAAGEGEGGGGGGGYEADYP